MTAPPPPHSTEHEELAALYALGVLEGEESAAFERHLAACTQCRTIVDQDRETIGTLIGAPLEMDPSPGFKARLLQRAVQELQTRGGEPATPRSSAPLRRVLTWSLPLAAALVLALVAGTLVGQQWYANQVLTSAVLHDGSRQGTATMIVRRSGNIELEFRDLDDPPAGHVYEVWIIGADGTPVPSSVSATGHATLTLDGPVLGKTVAITVERSPGVDAPTTQPILSATISL